MCVKPLVRGSPLLPERLQRNSLKVIKSEKLENESGRQRAEVGLANSGFLSLSESRHWRSGYQQRPLQKC